MSLRKLRKQYKVRTDSFLTDSSFSFSATFSRLTIFATVAQSAPLEFPPWIPCRLLLFGFGSGFLKKGSINSWNKEWQHCLKSRIFLDFLEHKKCMEWRNMRIYLKFEFPVFFSPIKKCGKSYFHNLYCYYRNFLHFLVINVYDTIWIFALKIICTSLKLLREIQIETFWVDFPT